MKVFKLFFAFLIGCFFVNCSVKANGQNNIFGMGGIIGVVTNDRVQFYQNSGNSWTVIPDTDLALSNGYKSVFGMTGIVGVVTNDRVQFYQNNGNSWTVIPDTDFIR